MPYSLNASIRWSFVRDCIICLALAFNRRSRSLCGIQLEFSRDPRGKFKCDILLCKCSTIAPRFRNDSDCTGCFDPFLWRHGKRIRTSLRSKPVEFDGFRTQAGSNAFTMSPKKWIEATGAIGIVSKAGRYGGTFAQKDIAFEFASWISAEFKLYTAKRTAPAVKCQCQTDDAVSHERPSNRGIQGIRHTAA